MELNTVGLNDFVKLAKVIWFKRMDSLPQYARSSGLFVEDPFPANTGEQRVYSEIDVQEYARRKPEGDQALRAKVQQGYSVTLQLYRVALDIGITYEMRTRNKYPDVIRRLTTLVDTGYNRLDLDLTHRFTFGSATSYTDMDGATVTNSVGDTLALFSTAHTLKGSGTSYRNLLANNPRLSKGALEGIERLIAEQTYNQLGEKVTVPFDILVTGDDPNTINTAREYLQSTASLDAGANAGVINVYKGKYRHVVLPRLATDNVGAPNTAKRYYWGIASSAFSSAFVAVHEEPHMKLPEDLNAGEEFSTDDWNFGVRAGWGIAIVSGAWLKWSYGDGTA